MAQTESKPITQEELSAILAGNVDSVITPSTPEKLDGAPIEEKKVEDKPEEKKSIHDNGRFKEPIPEFKWSDIEKIANQGEEGAKEGSEAINDTKPVETGGQPAVEDKKGPGRKPNDIFTIVQEMIDGGELLGFEEGEVKTQEDVKELLRLNLKHKEEGTFEDRFKEKVQNYSPQVQAIIDYAERGGQDISPLLSAIAEAEKTGDFTLETEAGQAEIITEYLRIQGWDAEDIKEEVETAKDLDKLKVKAERFLPKLNQMKTERIQMIMEEQEEKNRQVEQTRRAYLSTIQNTLKQDKIGDIKLDRQDKNKLWNALADVSYRSFNGTPTNAFYKRLEELQVGDKANYNEFLELVHFAIDREGFKKKLADELKTQVSASTEKKLRIQEQKATSGSSMFQEDTSKKPTLKRGFKNPWE